MLSDGRFRLTTWRGRDVYWDSEGMLRAATDEQVGIGWPGENRALFGIEQTWAGTARAVTLASEADKVVIVLGTNPVINGQIGQDREKYGLPSAVTGSKSHSLYAVWLSGTGKSYCRCYVWLI